MIPISIDEKTVAALSHPITKLIEVVSSGIGRVYDPIHTIRQAKAEGVAAVILAEAEIEVQDIQKRAFERVLVVETTRQKNIEGIVAKAQKSLPEKVSGNPVDPDWTMHYFDCVKDISNEEMQVLWARILAGEVAEPGKTSKRALNALKDMDRNDALLFSCVVFASVQCDGWFTLFSDRSIYSLLETVIRGAQIESVVNHLINIGLISSEPGLLEASSATGFIFSYSQKQYQMTGPPPPAVLPNGLKPLEKVLYIRSLTSVGQQLARFVTLEPFDTLISTLSKSLTEQFKVSIAEMD